MEERASRTPEVLTLRGFSVLEEAFSAGIVPGFENFARSRGLGELRVDASFASLGRIVQDLVNGAPADVAVLSAEVGVDELVAAGLASRARQDGLPFRGVLCRSPIVIVVRPGNPRGIRDFADLAAQDLGVVQPDPACADGGRFRGIEDLFVIQDLGGWQAARRDVIDGVWSSRTARR